MKIELHPGADAEFEAQVEYYDDQQPGLGERFYREVIATLDWLVENPTLPSRRKNYRRVNLQVFPFYIAYVVEGTLIRVLAVAHSRRRPRYWIKRMKKS